MLLEFTVENFLSFKEKQKLKFYADSLKELKTYVQIPVHYDVTMKVLKSLALHGHNSHGKSNFIKAYKLFNHIILNSFRRGLNNDSLSIESFALNTDSINKPSLFEVVFILKKVKYRYLLIATSNEILGEELHYAEPKIRENYLFKRELQSFTISKQWSKENNNELEDAVKFARPHILFLSVLISQEVTRTIEIADWLMNNIIITDFNEKGVFDQAISLSKNTEYTSLIHEFVKNADLGFETYLEKTQHQIDNDKLNLTNDVYYLLNSNNIKNFDLVTTHKLYNKQYEFQKQVYFDMQKNESVGTIKYFVIACHLVHAIKQNQLIFIDELDSSLHPHLLEMIIKLFSGVKYNSFGSQLVFTSHNTVLLDKKMRRDQLVLVEKNEYGESSIRKAHTSKTPIRTGKSVEKEYLKGDLKGVSKKIVKNIQKGLFD